MGGPPQQAWPRSVSWRGFRGPFRAQGEDAPAALNPFLTGSPDSFSVFSPSMSGGHQNVPNSIRGVALLPRPVVATVSVPRGGGCGAGGRRAAGGALP